MSFDPITWRARRSSARREARSEADGAAARESNRKTARAWEYVVRAAALAALTLVSAVPASAADVAVMHTYNPHLRPVSHISDTRMRIDTAAGVAELPLYISRDWDQPLPGIVRAVIVIHGKLRNADRYFDSAEKGRDAAREQHAADADANGTLLIAPQFLATLDFGGRSQPADLLRWDANGWMAGDAAVAPVPLSSYAALDAIVERLADRKRFPDLREVVFAGHSGGGQVVQRYAVAARETGALARDGIALRYVVSSPSSYAYFDAQRPPDDGKPFEPATCAGFDDWKYGMQKRPAYLADRTPAQLEAAYVARRVDYLVGGKDDDPQQKALDQSCPAEAQGPQRVARAEAYFDYLHARHPQGLNQQLHIVPGVGHDGARMLTSECALHAMYGVPGCAS